MNLAFSKIIVRAHGVCRSCAECTMVPVALLNTGQWRNEEVNVLGVNVFSIDRKHPSDQGLTFHEI